MFYISKKFHVSYHVPCATSYQPKFDTSSNDTSSNEQFRLKVTSSKWHFVDCAQCQKTVSLNSFDEKISRLIVSKPVVMLFCWSEAHHYGQWLRTLVSYANKTGLNERSSLQFSLFQIQFYGFSGCSLIIRPKWIKFYIKSTFFGHFFDAFEHLFIRVSRITRQ